MPGASITYATELTAISLGEPLAREMVLVLMTPEYYSPPPTRLPLERMVEDGRDNTLKVDERMASLETTVDRNVDSLDMKVNFGHDGQLSRYEDRRQIRRSEGARP